MIPIVQAGKHAQWLGKLRLDYRKDMKRLFVKDYELLPVNQDSKDPEIEGLIDLANDQLNYHFGEDWLEEPLGESRITPIHQGGNLKYGITLSRTLWSRRLAPIWVFT